MREEILFKLPKGNLDGHKISHQDLRCFSKKESIFKILFLKLTVIQESVIRDTLINNFILCWEKLLMMILILE